MRSACFACAPPWNQVEQLSQHTIRRSGFSGCWHVQNRAAELTSLSFGSLDFVSYEKRWYMNWPGFFVEALSLYVSRSTTSTRAMMDSIGLLSAPRQPDAFIRTQPAGRYANTNQNGKQQNLARRSLTCELALEQLTLAVPALAPPVEVLRPEVPAALDVQQALLVEHDPHDRRHVRQRLVALQQRRVCARPTKCQEQGSKTIRGAGLAEGGRRTAYPVLHAAFRKQDTPAGRRRRRAPSPAHGASAALAALLPDWPLLRAAAGSRRLLLERGCARCPCTRVRLASNCLLQLPQHSWFLCAVPQTKARARAARLSSKRALREFPTARSATWQRQKLWAWRGALRPKRNSLELQLLNRSNNGAYRAVLGRLPTLSL